MGRILNPRRLFPVLAAGAIALTGGLPICFLLIRTIMIQGRIDLSRYITLWTFVRTWVLLGHSLALSGLTTLFALGIGVPLGLILNKSDLSFRKPLIFIFSLPLLLPPYILAVAWSGILTLCRIHMDRFFGLAGCVFVLSITLMPIAMFLVLVASAQVDSRLEEAGRLVCGWRIVLSRITLPVIASSIGLAAILVFLSALGELSVPLFLHYSVFPVETLTQFAAFYDPGMATTAGVSMILIVCALLFLLKKRTDVQTLQFRTPVAAVNNVVHLGNARPWIFTAVGLLAVIGVFLPLVSLSIQTGTVATFREAWMRMRESLLCSAVYAAFAATVLTVLGFIIGIVIHRKSSRLWASFSWITVFLFALPGAILGIALIGFWNQIGSGWIYGTPALLLLGFVAQYLFLPIWATTAALDQIPSSLDEAARLAEMSEWRRLFRITMPLAKPGILAGWILGFIFCLRDTGVSMLTYAPGFDPFPVRLFTLMPNAPKAWIAASCLLLVGIAICSLVSLKLVLKGWLRL